MKNFLKIGSGVHVMPLLQAVVRQPELWDQHKWRTTYKGTPHVDVSDIWLRYSDTKATGDTSNLAPVIQDIAPVWYPAFKSLPQARSIIGNLMAAVDGYELGRVLITKIKPGGRILPHRDAEGAYTEQNDGVRYHVVLQGLPGSLFRAGDETVCMQTGEVWSFNHREEHEVMNNSSDDRIHLLVDIRSMP